MQGTGKVAQWAKCLLHRHEDLSSDPHKPHKVRHLKIKEVFSFLPAIYLSCFRDELLNCCELSLMSFNKSFTPQFKHTKCHPFFHSHQWFLGRVVRNSVSLFSDHCEVDSFALFCCSASLCPTNNGSSNSTLKSLELGYKGNISFFVNYVSLWCLPQSRERRALWCYHQHCMISASSLL